MWWCTWDFRNFEREEEGEKGRREKAQRERRKKMRWRGEGGKERKRKRWKENRRFEMSFVLSLDSCEGVVDVHPRLKQVFRLPG